MVKDGCGIFGILRKNKSPKISAETALEGIESVRYRGSNLGAGFSAFNLSAEPSQAKLKVFVRSKEDLLLIRKKLESLVPALKVIRETIPELDGREFQTYQAVIQGEGELQGIANELNELLSNEGVIRARVYCFARYQEVFKGVGFPEDVAADTELKQSSPEADMWVAHTRQPTNSPGVFPIWSHPFAASEWAVAHNGDISSFGANYQLLKSVGVKSLAGTDRDRKSVV